MDANEHLTLAALQILNKDLEGKPGKYSWKYWIAVGILSYLQANIWLDISISVHHTTRFCNNPMYCHEQAVIKIG